MSGSSHSHVGPLFHEVEEFIDMMSRGYVHVHVCCCDRVGQIGERGSLKREWWGAGCGNFEAPRW
jgi:hypothetical protein